MRTELTSFLLKAESSTLTPNQKKKRRQKLSKLGKSANSSEEGTRTCSSTAAESSQAVSSTLPVSQAADHPPTACASVILSHSLPGVSQAQGSAAAQCAQDLAANSPAHQPATSAASQPALFSASKAGAPLLPNALICRADCSGAAALLLHQESEPASDIHPQAPDAEQETRSAGPVGLFVHGNYSSYYSRRFGEGLGEDPRLEVLDRRWFRNKRCLDIGCNDGRLTLTMAAKYGCASMLGLDIDASLIKQACRALHRARGSARDKKLELMKTQNRQHGHSTQSMSARRKAAAAACQALSGTSFQVGDAVGHEGSPGSLDMVTCFSVTKWVHLNQGDEGLMAMFRAVHGLLAPRGCFVLEPQPWRSYRNASKKKVREAAGYKRLEELAILPQDFPQALTDIGLIYRRQLRAPDSTAGFDRPIYLFTKG